MAVQKQTQYNTFYSAHMALSPEMKRLSIIAAGVVLFVALILWFLPGIAFAADPTINVCEQVQLNQDLGSTEEKGILLDGVSNGCYVAGFCGQCDVLVVLKNIAEINFGILGLFATLFLVIGGVTYIVSGGNEKTAEVGKKTISATIFGLILSFLAWSAVTTIAQVISGDPNQTLTSVQCQDIPAVSTCNLSAGIQGTNLFNGAISGAPSSGGATGGGISRGAGIPKASGTRGSITSCGIDQVPIYPQDERDIRCSPRKHIGGEVCLTMKQIKEAANSAARKTGVDPVFLLAIGATESGLNKNIGPSVTGAYGIMQFQPSTFADRFKNVSGVPASCLNRQKGDGTPYNRATATGYCRSYVRRNSKYDPDPSCGAVTGDRSVIEKYARTCEEWIETNPDKFMEGAALYLKAKLEKNGGSLFDAACGYNAGGWTCAGRKASATGYAQKTEQYYRGFCTEFKEGGPSSLVSPDIDKDNSHAKKLADISIQIPATKPSTQNINLRKVVHWGDSFTEGYTELGRIPASQMGIKKWKRGERSTAGREKIEAYITSGQAADASAFVVNYGINDLHTDGEFAGDVAKLARNMKAIVEKAHANNIPVFVTTLPDRSGIKLHEGRGRAAAEDMQNAFKAYNAWVREQHKRGAIDGVVDWEAVVPPATESIPDIHPREHYSTMGRAVINELK